MTGVSVLKGRFSANGLSRTARNIAILFVVRNVVTMCACKEDGYLQEREKLLREDKDIFIGADVNLTENQEIVEEYLLKLKKMELQESYENSSKFLPAQNFLISKRKIEESQVFQFIRKVPKGGSLHTHMLAGVNIDYIIQNFTYMDNVYACYNDLNVFKLKVLRNPKQDENCSWKSLNTYRKEFAEKGDDFDAFLKEKLTLGADSVSESKETVWEKFKNTFTTLYDLIAYRPLFKQYVKQLLQELYEDNVIYTELRGTFMPLYDLNDTTYDTNEFFKTFIEAVGEFKETHPDFVGAKYIHSIYRGVDNDTLRSGLEQLLYYNSVYPDIIAGFDFVGLEEDGKNLVDFYDELIGVSNDLHFFFHAGETNQYGRTDLNLADAILLNSSRIGHGFALAKHPKLLDAARKQGIAIELAPISNQVLKLIEDPRNHPAAILLSKGHPVVICNDDPSAWEATGLSYDWYVVFMSMTWEDHGLKVLKQLAQNSIIYSALKEEDKIAAVSVWQAKWNKFINEIIKSINRVE